QQRYTVTGGNLMARETQGHFSWLATLVPKVEIYSGQASDEYVLSIVMFLDRPADLDATDPYHERVVDVEFQGGGSTGGEVLRHWTAAQSSANDELAAEQLKVRANDWIMIAGNQYYVGPSGVVSVPRFQWYRVTHCDAAPIYNQTANTSFNNN